MLPGRSKTRLVSGQAETITAPGYETSDLHTVPEISTLAKTYGKRPTRESEHALRLETGQIRDAVKSSRSRPRSIDGSPEENRPGRTRPGKTQSGKGQAQKGVKHRQSPGPGDPGSLVTEGRKGPRNSRNSRGFFPSPVPK